MTQEKDTGATDGTDRPAEDSDGASANPAGALSESDASARARLETQEAEARERLLRLAAEYENFKRRTAKEREEWTERALDAFVTDLLPVLDSFDRALAAKAVDAAAAASGLEVTERQLRSVLAKHGVDAVDPAGKPFDPRFHEAISRGAADGKAPGTVLAVHERGYTLRGRLLRPARVHVAAPPEDA